MAATLIKQWKLEPGLVGRGLEGFQRRSAVEVQPSGVSELDALLSGGFPRGSLVELCGDASSGRTSLAFSLLAQATERQEACAFVDVSDSLDPLSLAAAGVELSRLLWIRCGGSEGQEPDMRTSPYFVAASKEIEKGFDLGPERKKPMHANGWKHPRELMRGVEHAIPMVMGSRASAPVPKTGSVVARCAGEQVERDREPPRRGIRPPRSLPKLESAPVREARFQSKGTTKPWKRLEQALKTTDLLLHGGGWGVVVVDLGGISWVDARRINLSMWFRFRRAVENTSTTLLLLGEESCAKSCASLVLRCQRKTDNWTRAATEIPTGAATFDGFEVQGEVARSRAASQSADSARWKIRTP
jgi:recombination protein RecA